MAFLGFYINLGIFIVFIENGPFWLKIFWHFFPKNFKKTTKKGTKKNELEKSNAIKVERKVVPIDADAPIVTHHDVIVKAEGPRSPVYATGHGKPKKKVERNQAHNVIEKRYRHELQNKSYSIGYTV